MPAPPSSEPLVDAKSPLLKVVFVVAVLGVMFLASTTRGNRVRLENRASTGGGNGGSIEIELKPGGGGVKGYDDPHLYGKNI